MPENTSSSDHAYHPIPYHPPQMAPAAQVAASQHFLAVMASRRTVRDYAPDPVPFELIANAIRAASLAPSGANMQPWTFVVVSDPVLKRQMRVAAEEEERLSYEQRMAPEWLAALAPLGTDWRKPHIETAPFVIVVFGQRYGLARGPDGIERKIKHYYVQESVGIAVGFLLASLTHAGLATLTHTPSPMGFLRELLQRPANEYPYVLIPVGYPAQDATVPDITKKALDDVLVRFD
jgi:iodotyrosine deiodinase